MKYILLLWMTLPSGNTYWAPGTYYESKYQCHVKVAQLAGTLNKTGMHWNYLCGEIVPEVPEE